MSDYEFEDYSQDESTLTDLDRAKKLSDTLSVSDRGYLIRYILWDNQLSVDDLFTIYDRFLLRTADDSDRPLFSKASIDRIKKLLSPPPTPSLDCPKCHSSTFKNGRHGDKQRYLCKKCKYQFIR